MSYVTSRSRAPRRRSIQAGFGATFLALVLAAGMPACDALDPDELLGADNKGKPGSTAAASLKPVSISPQETFINAIGHERELQVTVLNPAGKPRENASASWRSLTPGVATVDDMGRVSAVAVGMALITATAGNQTDTARVHVRQVAATVAITPASASLTPGGTLQLAATASDSNDVQIPRAVFAWNSAHPEIARVDASGRVAAQADGAVSITAMALPDSVTATVVIQVDGPQAPPPPPPAPPAAGHPIPTNSLRFAPDSRRLGIEEMRKPTVVDERGNPVSVQYYATYGSSPAKSTRIINTGGTDNGYIRGKRQGWAMVIARDYENNRIGYAVYGVDMPSPQITSGYAPISCGTDCYAPPSSIDATGSRSVTWELMRFFDQVPDGAPGRPVTVRLRTGAQYRSDATLTLLNRKHLRIEGGGARIFQTENQAGAYRRLLNFMLGTQIEVRDLTLQGSNPTPGVDGVWNSAREFETGMYVEGVQGFHAENVEVLDTWGDGIHLRYDSFWTKVPLRDAVIARSRIYRIGRQGITITGSEHVVIGGSPQQANYIGDVKRSIIDIEPIGWAQPVRRIEISHNRIGRTTNNFVAAGGHHAPVEHIDILYNVLEGSPLNIYVATPTGEKVSSNPDYRRNNIRVIGNVSDRSSSFHVVRLHRVDHFEVRGNTQMIAATSGDRCFVFSPESGGRKVVESNTVIRHGKIVPEYTVEAWCDLTMNQAPLADGQ